MANARASFSLHALNYSKKLLPSYQNSRVFATPFFERNDNLFISRNQVNNSTVFGGPAALAITTLPSNKLLVALAIELPYWIPIKSGDYTLHNERTIRLRNDLWMVSTGNVADDPDPPSDFIANEEQVIDEAVLENRTGGQAKYLHKRKMNTTFTRTISDISPEGLLLATRPSDDWIEQLNKTVFGTLQNQNRLDEFLEDANLFIDLYSTIINPRNASREVRQVSFYETMIHLRINLQTEHFRFENLTRITPDWKMVGQPYPPSRVTNHTILKEFCETIQSSPPVAFHQLEWVKTLNYRREKRYQDALLHASITLETIAHIHLFAKGIKSRNKRKEIIKKAGGLGEWLLSLNIEGLSDECKRVTRLRTLRNDIVHREKVLAKDDIELVISGIDSLERVRTHLLHTGAPEILELESKFKSFLEPVELGRSLSGSVGQMVLMRFRWRKEKNCYRAVRSRRKEKM